MVSQSLATTLARIAPGTELRDGLERILRGRTGGLIVLGYNDTVASICSGGFDIDINFTPTRMRELAKMDGGIICSADGNRILKAGVQLLPDPSIETHESGTRHRTAERVAVQTNFPVISVSQSMSTIAIYVAGRRYVLEDSEKVLVRANQALATLERYRTRLDQVTTSLSALEIEAMVTIRDVASVLQRQEMVRRISEEIARYIVELGADGRLLALQLEELSSHVDFDSEIVIQDYVPKLHDRELIHDLAQKLQEIPAADLIDTSRIAVAAGLATSITGGGDLEKIVQPHGYRLLSSFKSLPRVVIGRLVDHFGDLQSLLAATTEDLVTVEGVGEHRAHAIREGLSRIAEASLLDRLL